jgi:hydrogenase maturation protease
MAEPATGDGGVLVLGIGNTLMRDEGVGVHAVQLLEGMRLPAGVECLDGGTSSFQLLEPLSRASRVIMIDATADGAPPGTVRRLRPRFASDYPPTLTAHDIGLKDLLDVFYLTGTPADVTLYTVSIALPEEIGLDLSPEALTGAQEAAELVLGELQGADHVAPARPTPTAFSGDAVPDREA